MVIAVVGIRRSRTGRVLIAIRENERAATAFGVNARATTLGVFAISGFLAAFAGALFVHQQNGLQLDSYSAGESLVVFTMVVIGGLGSVPGALLGALFVRGVTWWLPVEWQILATGAGMLVVLLVFRGGLGAAFADLRDRFLRRVARRRGLSVPALTGVTPGVVRDDGAPPSPAAPVTDGRPAALRVRELAVSYDDVPVLFDVDLDADAGEIVALLGTNGSGKSTLLAAVSGLRAPDRGEVVIDGSGHHPHPPGTDRRAWARCRPRAGTACSRRSPWPRTSAWRRGRCATRPRRQPRVDDVLRSVPAPPRARSGSAPATCRAASSRCSP